MNIRSHDNGNGKRIIVRLGSPGSGEYSLDETAATQLRDALTRELGAPQVLTYREAMVWATEFVRAMAADVHSSVAARSAANVVSALLDPSTQWVARDGDQPATVEAARAMLAAMTGGSR